MVSLGLLDGKAMGVLCALKAYRFMSFWILLFVMDKLFQTQYVQSVYVDDGPPPQVWLFPLYVVGAEAVAFLLVFLVLLMLERRFKSTHNTFIIDETLLWQALTDYVLTTACIVVLGLGIAYAIRKCGLRYSHDGLRGIRALSRTMLYSVAVILALPFFIAY
jgi:hypothetical protein